MYIFYLLTRCIYVNYLIDGPLKITFVGDMVTLNNKAFIIIIIIIIIIIKMSSNTSM